MKLNYIWLFGENSAGTAENNSFVLWKDTVLRDAGIEKYFILKKTAHTKRIVRGLGKARRFVVWKDSLWHLRLFLKSDLFFVTLGCKDVLPERLFFKPLRLAVSRPLIYLQHGTLGMKRISINGRSYDNHLCRFFCYNPHIAADLIRCNDYQPYQLYFAGFHPRYQKTVSLYFNWLDRNGLTNRAAAPVSPAEIKTDRTVFWFLTWRDYLENGASATTLADAIQTVCSDERLARWAAENRVTITLCLHRNFRNTSLKLPKLPHIGTVWASDTDIAGNIAESFLLITDYSSLGFDFTLLGKPVLLFQPDFAEYTAERAFYCTEEALRPHRAESPAALIAQLIGGQYAINRFFADRLASPVDYAALMRGDQNQSINRDMVALQQSRVTFLAARWHEDDASSAALCEKARAMMRSFLEAGCLVRCVLLYAESREPDFPNGVSVEPVVRAFYQSRAQRLKLRLFCRRSYLRGFDARTRAVLPAYCGYALKKIARALGNERVVCIGTDIRQAFVQYNPHNQLLTTIE
ncbi:MAG: CDP-glycerol glycerophosphotransferase family protein [Oscillospiraceae bacterium]